MSSTILDTKVKRKSKVASSMPRMRHSWPLYSGREPTLEELSESVKSLTPVDVDRILRNAGIIDEKGNFTEIYT